MVHHGPDIEPAVTHLITGFTAALRQPGNAGHLVPVVMTCGASEGKGASNRLAARLLRAVAG